MVGTKFTRRMFPNSYYLLTITGDGIKIHDGRVSNNQRAVDFVTHGPNEPYWRSRIDNGLNVSTSLSGSKTVFKMSEGFQEYGSKVSPYRQLATGRFAYVAGFPNTFQSFVVDQAATKAMISFAKRWGNISRQWDSGVFAGELFEAARLLSNPARGLRSAVDTLYKQTRRSVRGLKPGTSHYRRNLSSAYLEWNFGVKPLVSDLDSAARAFRAIASGRTFDIVRIVGEGTAEADLPVSISRTWTGQEIGGFGGSYSRYISGKDSSNVTIRGAWRNENSSGEMPLPNIIGLSLDRVVPTAWELLPYSFLADYFSNIGDVLDAWSLRFVNFAWMNQTIRNERLISLSDIVAGPPSAGLYQTVGGGQAVVKFTSVSRQPRTSAFNPHFQVKIPGFGTDSKKWLNIAALLSMRLP